VYDHVEHVIVASVRDWCPPLFADEFDPGADRFMSPASPSRIQVERIDDIAVARLVDERIVDDLVIQSLGEDLMSLVDRDGYTRIVLNFGSVHYMASAVIGQIFKLNKKLQASRGKLAFCSIRPDLKVVFDITGLSKMVPLFAEEQAAVDACS
jgi:anti-anti-sigma factor